jgi:hypothetical protein
LIRFDGKTQPHPVSISQDVPAIISNASDKAGAKSDAAYAAFRAKYPLPKP